MTSGEAATRSSSATAVLAAITAAEKHPTASSNHVTATAADGTNNRAA